MNVNNKINTSRLRRLSEFVDGFSKNKQTNTMYSIFKNPTNDEIELAKSDGNYNSIRGVIYTDGTEYCWSGSVLHNQFNLYSDLKLEIDNCFRFACEPYGWVLDYHKKSSVKDCIIQLIENKNKLEKYGDLNSPLALVFPSGNFNEIYDYISEENLVEFGINTDPTMLYCKNGISSCEEIYKRILTKTSSRIRMKRFSEFIDGFDKNGNMISVFKNPTPDEIQIAKSESGYGSIRGVINSDGTEYCWSGETLHYQINQQLSKSKSNTNIDVNNCLRFTANNDGWAFDAHNQFTFQQYIQLIIKYKNNLSNYWDIDNSRINIFFPSNAWDMQDILESSVFRGKQFIVDDDILIIKCFSVLDEIANILKIK